MEPTRDNEGFCVECWPGETGLMATLILGMATLMTLDVDIKKLGEQLKADLPAYAKPLFIR